MTDTQPRVLSLEAWAKEQGRKTIADLRSHVHAGLRSAPQTKTYKRWNERTFNELSAEAAETARLYRAEIAAGRILERPVMTRRQRLEETANGHPDLPATAAAKRMLAKLEMEPA